MDSLRARHVIEGANGPVTPEADAYLNAKGVVLDLRGRKAGFEFSANLSGVEVALAR